MYLRGQTHFMISMFTACHAIDVCDVPLYFSLWSQKFELSSICAKRPTLLCVQDELE